MPGPESALVGQPPLTADDRLIVHGWQVLFGMAKMDPSRGLKVAIPPPQAGQPDDSNTNSLIAGSSISLILIVLFTGTRITIRATHRSLAFGWDDWAMIIASLLAALTPIFMLYKIVNAGAGKHVYDVTYWELANHQMITIPSFALFYVAIAAIKISILFFYMRLTSFTSRAWMIFHRTFVACLVICALTSLFVTVFFCNPPIFANIRAIAMHGSKPTCLPLVNMIIGFNTWHILSDCLLLIIPFMMLWRVQMSWTTKLKVCIVGIVGFANVGLALARTIIQATPPPRKGFDITYAATSSFQYSNAEVTLAVFTANLPVLSIIATKTVKKLSWASLSGGGADSPPRNHSSSSPAATTTRNHHRVLPSRRQQGLSDAVLLSKESEKSFGSCCGRAEGPPTVRHDVEYGLMRQEGGREMGVGRAV